MKTVRLLYMLLTLVVPAVASEEGATHELGTISPDGKFKVVRHSLTEVDAGKPVYTVIEAASGKVLWSAPDSFADAARPEDKILWSPDSKHFAMGTRVSIRRISLFIFGWDGKTFVEQWAESAKLEDLADAKALKELQKAEGTKDAELGRCLSDQSIPERWVNDSSLVVTREVEHIGFAKGEEAGTTAGLARVLLRWNAKANAFFITQEAAPQPRTTKP